jgi:hypothetical protein
MMEYLKTFLIMLAVFTLGACACYGGWITVLRFINYPGPEWWVLPVVIVIIAAIMSIVLNTNIKP